MVDGSRSRSTATRRRSWTCLVGAQVVSSTILKPNQRIRLTIPNGAPPVRVSAAVAWRRFEIPKAGVRYRAGIEFFDADQKVLARLSTCIRQISVTSADH